MPLIALSCIVYFNPGLQALIPHFAAQLTANRQTEAVIVMPRTEDILLTCVAEASTNTSLTCEVESHTPLCSEASTNTSFVCPERENADTTSLRKRLEAAHITNKLLRSSLEDSEKRVAAYETSGATLRRELKDKETQVANMRVWMTETIKKLEVCFKCPPPFYGFTCYSPLFSQWSPLIPNSPYIASSIISHCSAIAPSRTSCRESAGSLPNSRQYKNSKQVTFQPEI